ncbi:hypothetical protein [Xenorhabdus sp. TH1]|uniref:hypothetical protein n=1 Tax=Xenorhabdus sp. TH1 TaxID=3130166 RepID=UPI0030D58941
MATNKFRFKDRSSINSRAAKIEEIRKRLEIKKPIIASKNKEKITHDVIKKKTDYTVEYENRFKAKLKSKLKKETSKAPQQETEQRFKYQTFKLY